MGKYSEHAHENCQDCGVEIGIYARKGAFCRPCLKKVIAERRRVVKEIHRWAWWVDVKMPGTREWEGQGLG